MNKLINIS